MCGIVGVIGRQDPGWLSKMNEVLCHRGPDDLGEYRDAAASVSLAMRRLSILDIGGGHQPMSNDDGTLWVVHNGEIYNSPEIRARLTANGVPFRSSHSDTEVLLHLYERNGTDMLWELNGMFAFVIYDKNRRRLFGARDRFGIKPLYLHESPGGLAFASELKSLLVLPDVRREVDPAALFHYMSLLYVPGESSIIRGVRRLPPAHWFTYELKTRTFRSQCYWNLDVSSEQHKSEQDWAAGIREQLRDAVGRWTLSDVPVGCSLSGGIDSSAIVGLLAETGHRVKTYSLGFTGADEQDWNELPLARQVARKWGTEHHELVVQPEELLRDLVKMVWHLDEPYGGGLPAWNVFQFMRQHVTVGLTGTGGDEVFGNYGKFGTLEKGFWGQLGMSYRRALGNNGHTVSGPSRLVRPLWEAACDSPMKRYFNSWYYLSDPVKRERVFRASAEQRPPDTATLLEELHKSSQTRNVRDGIAYVDMKTQLADEFLFMTDRFSMAHSLEARVPFLDHRFVEFVFRIPADQRTRAGDPKILLKKAVEDLLPPELLSARKRGFVLPIRLWLRKELRPLAESLLSRKRLAQQEIFQPGFYDSFVSPHLEGQADYTWQVWAALMFQLWHLVFLERKATEAPSFTWRDL